ncbi:MAG: universal stress protein [Thermoplasmata archaeon]|nr:universal stress protein [Thermoplasmata archaeon]
MFDRILVCIDGSTEGQRACRIGVDVAARFQSRLTLVTVLPAGSGETDAVLATLVPRGDEHKTLKTQFEEARAAAIARGVPTVDVVYLQGKVADAILEYVRTNPHELLVVGSRGLLRGSRLLLGSVSAALATSAPCHVLVVRPLPKKRAAPNDPAGPAPPAPPG